MSAREYLKIVKEASLGTAMASPVAGTDSIVVRLSEAGFTMLADPVVEMIPYGGGFAVDADEVSDHYDVKGQLKTKLYPSQATLLLSWWLARINALQTSPWTTTEPAGDLASCTIYHAVRRSDGSYTRKRYAGVKVGQGELAASRQGNALVLTLDLVGARSYGNAMDGTSDPDATEFPLPAESDYPTGPYTFRHSAGNFILGTARTQYEDLSFKSQNVLDARFFETAFLTAIPALGRKTTLDSTLLFKSAPDDRTAYEARTAQSASLKFDNGVNSFKLDLHGKNRIAKLPYSLTQNQQYMLKMAMQTYWDATANAGAGGDVDLVFT